MVYSVNIWMSSNFCSDSTEEFVWNELIWPDIKKYLYALEPKFVIGVGVAATGGVSGLVTPGASGTIAYYRAVDFYGGQANVTELNAGLSGGTGSVLGLYLTFRWGVDRVQNLQCNLADQAPFPNPAGGGRFAGGRGGGASIDIGPGGVSLIVGAAYGKFGGANSVINSTIIEMVKQGNYSPWWDRRW